MTVTEDRPQMLAEEFERIAAAAEREGVRLEFVHGRMGVKAAPDGDHDEIIRRVMEHCMQQRPDLWLYPERGLKVETYRKGHAKPDGALAPKGSFAGQGEWASADHVQMVVEVTSYDTDTDKRDREDKPRAYAQTGIPVYLLIDRDSCELLVFSEPEDGAYTTLTRRPFGKTVELPAPVGTADAAPGRRPGISQDHAGIRTDRSERGTLSPGLSWHALMGMRGPVPVCSGMVGDEPCRSKASVSASTSPTSCSRGSSPGEAVAKVAARSTRVRRSSRG